MARKEPPKKVSDGKPPTRRPRARPRPKRLYDILGEAGVRAFNEEIIAIMREHGVSTPETKKQIARLVSRKPTAHRSLYRRHANEELRTFNPAQFAESCFGNNFHIWFKEARLTQIARQVLLPQYGLTYEGLRSENLDLFTRLEEAFVAGKMVREVGTDLYKAYLCFKRKGVLNEHCWL